MKATSQISSFTRTFVILVLIAFGPIAGYLYGYHRFERAVSTGVSSVSPSDASTSNIKQSSESERKRVTPPPEAGRPKVGNSDRLSGAIAAFSTSTLTDDGRILITRSVLDRLFAEQEANPTLFTNGWNSDYPNTWVKYSNDDFGIRSMELPYNKSWGNRTFALAPYEMRNQNSLQFGVTGMRIENDVFHEWPGSLFLTVTAKRDLSLLEHVEPGMPYPDGLKVEVINGHRVAHGGMWADYAGRNPVMYEVEGSRFNYVLNQSPMIPDDEELMRSIVERMNVE